MSTRSDQKSKANVEDIYPLSPLQEGMLFHALVDGGSDAYFEQVSLTLVGALDLDAFEAAWRAVIAQHEILRTSFHWDGLKRPMQMVHRTVPFALGRTSLAGHAAQADALATIRAEDRRRRFVLSEAPLVRATVIELGPGRHELVWSFHHLLLDGWSTPLVTRALLDAYAQLKRGASVLPHRAPKYRDYISWLAKQDLGAAERHFRQLLAGFTTPTTIAARGVGSHDVAQQTMRIDGPLAESITRVAREHQTTVNVVMQAAWGLLLSRYTRTRDVVFGVTMAGRPPELSGVEDMVGLFINTLPLRVELDESANLAPLLRGVHLQQHDLARYAYAPLSTVQRCSDVDKDEALFESLFVFESYPLDDSLEGAHPAGLEVAGFEAFERTSYPLTVVVVPGKTLRVTLVYERPQLDAAMTDQLLRHYRRVLEGLVARPEAPLHELALLDDDERRRILADWNATTRAHPTDRRTHEGVAAWAKATPGALAVEQDGRVLTYADLDTRANRLARLLQRRGVGPETIVAICAERSLEMVIGMLAVMKAGGAYVPLDTAYPDDRLRYVLHDSGAVLVLTQSRFLDMLGRHRDAAICFDRDAAAIEAEEATAPPSIVRPDNLAYVIYTSGSTGQPKGVAIPHRGLENLVAWHARAFEITPRSRATQLASAAFDATVWELWPYLASGASLHIVPEDVRSDDARLLGWLASHRITISFAATPLAEQILASTGTPADEPALALERLLTGADRLRKHPSASHGFTLVNNYGPTENTVVSTAGAVSAHPRLGVPSIGKPIDNVTAYILDDRLELVPPGVVGDLFLAGAQLARGYVHRADLTAERFTPNPHGDRGARMYATGDLARWLPNGEIDFVGRVDHQVKIRGFRVELGEIEHAVLAVSGVREATVLAREDRPGELRLVGYLVGDVDLERLNAVLCDKLPAYMVPSTWVLLDAMPLTPNGKIDRRALRAPTTSDERTYVAPRDQLEEQLATIWQEVLGAQRVGVHDDFFALGGHSLVATRLMSQVRLRLKLDLPVRALFEDPTVAALAKRIVALRAEATKTASPPLAPSSRTGKDPLSFAQQRLWFLHQLSPQGGAWNMGTTLRLDGPLVEAALVRAFDELLRRHESLRTVFPMFDGQPAQRVLDAPASSLLFTDLSKLSPAARAPALDAGLRDAHERPFDLENGPLFAARLYRLGEDAHVLSIRVHHIVCDGGSVGVFVRDLGALYAAQVAAAPSPLSPLSIQYIDYARWQLEAMRGDALEKQLEYWRAQLAGAHHLRLPTDEPSHTGPRLGQSSTTLAVELTGQLHALAREAKATPFMAVLAGFQLLLGRLGGTRDVAIGCAMSNRARAETEGLIGLFLNVVVLRTALADDVSFRDLLASVRATTLAAYAHQDLPFEKLVTELRPERSASGNPFFDVLINSVPPDAQSFSLGGLHATSIELDAVDVKYPLTLYVYDEGERTRLDFVYDRASFSDVRIHEMSRQLSMILEQLAAEPARTIDRTSLVTPRSRALVGDPNDPLAEPALETVSTMFAAWAARTPTALAIRQEGQVLSYGDLAAQVDRAAADLVAFGVRPRDVVVVTGERSHALVACALAVFGCGGVLLLLDPKLPLARRQEMCRLAGAKLAIRTGAAGDLGDLSLETIVWSPANARLDGGRGVGSLPSLRPEDPAYLFFTSGTTGTPKGVLGSHRGLSHFLAWQRETFAVGPGDRSAQLTALSFDVVLRDLFLVLTSGATLCLPSPELDVASAEAVAWMAAEKITLLHVVPSVARVWLAQPEAATPALRWVFFAGEPLTDTLVERWRARFGASGGLANFYGPTETSLAKCSYVVPATPPRGVQPVGRPQPHAQALVWSGDRPCGIGEPGEIVIRTPFRSLGYLHPRAEDAARFVVNPFTRDPHDLVYRTGDLGRLRPDGELEILGRVDHQVKIRGVRVELGEIESALGQHPSVRANVVVAVDVAEGDKRLVAYVVTGEPRPTSHDLKDRLARVLPETMLPSSFMFLSAMPLLPNGKIDRKALPAPTFESADAHFVAPRTALERQLAEIWRSLLHVPRVGVHDSFFEIGGHSLLATQLVSEVRQQLGVRLPLRAVFDDPTVERLAARCEVERARGAVEGPALRARDWQPYLHKKRDAHVFPLSFAQERLWFLEQLDPGNAAYNIPSAVRLQGPLDVIALTAALNEVVRRHATLRTHFFTEDGVGRQAVASRGAIEIPVEDLRGIDAVAREGVIADRLRVEATRPFDLVRGPPLRGKILRLSSNEHVLMFTMHHIVSDAWSIGRLVREVGLLYGAKSGVTKTTLPPLDVQYPDYVLWLRERLSGEELERQAGYWRQALTGAPPVLVLPTDRPRPPVQSHRGGSLTAALSPTLSAAVHQLAKLTAATPYMVLMTGFQLLMMKYSRERDVVIGTPIAGRQHKELEPLIGLFVNTLAMRLRLSGDENVEALLARVREQTLAAYANQDIPFERLVDDLKPTRSLGHTPLFQVMLIVQNSPVDEGALPGLAAELVEQERTAAKFDLELSVVEIEGKFDVTYTYASDLFDRETIERLARHYARLLEAMAAHPSARPSTFTLLDGAERTKLVGEWNATAHEPDRGGLIHDMFVEQAAKTPDAVALRWDAKNVSFGELDARSNQLAHALRKRGLSPEARVGICLDRSPDMVVALLGVLKAGCAYVPLDPSYPQARLLYMLTDAHVELVISSTPLLARLETDTPALCLDAGALANEPRVPVANRTHPDNVAYVVYTSGSTGRPKGVMGTHRATVNRMRWMLRTLPFATNEVTCQKTAISFVDSIWEIFGPLAGGIPSVIIPDEQLKDPNALVGVLAEHRVSRIVLVPSLLRALLETHDAALGVRLPSLVAWSVSGEALENELLERFKRCVPRARLVNLYGSSEVAGDATADLEAQNATRASIGVPMDNTQVYIFDDDGQLAPVGVPGELYVGGLNVARGYFAMPALTAEKLVPDPFGRGQRLYRTGDLARWLPNGTLEYIGRVDHQVKVRGFRIELGEIEAQLARLPGVRDTVVIVREDQPGDRRVVAYLVGTIDLTGLRETLRAALPEYMVPATFVKLDAFPLTPSGKIDRKALPTPAHASERAYVAPRTPTEEAVAAIYASIIAGGMVGAEDDFFALGGNSLQAMRLVSRIRQTLGVEVPVRRVFEQGSVAALARAVDTALAEARVPERPPLVALPPRERYPLSSYQARTWNWLRHAPTTRQFNLHYLSVVGPDIEASLMERTFEEVLRRHSILRTTYHEEDGKPYQVIGPNKTFELTRFVVSADASDDEVVRRMYARTQLAFDLSKGPLVQADLFQIGARRFLLVRLHHIVADRWSIDLLEDELVAVYQALAQGMPSPLAALPVQYVDFAVWQESWLTPEIARAQLDYWDRLLADCAPVVLRSQRPRPDAQGSAAVQGALGPEATARAHAFLRTNDATIFMLTAAACAVVLARESGSLDQIIGVPIANRPDASLEHVVGYFVNHLALRVRLAPTMTARELVGLVREQTLNLHASRDVLVADSIARDMRDRLYQFRLNVAPSRSPEPPVTQNALPELPSNVPFELGFYVTEAKRWTGVTLRYRASLYEPATAERIHRDTMAMVDAIATTPELTIENLVALRTP